MYSQNLEEQVILDYFKGRVGTFLDLGANDGETFSNTRAIAERGWKGVLIEADPNPFEELKKLYKGHRGIYTYNYAIGAYNGKRMLQCSGSLLHQEDSGLVSTFHAHEMDRFKRSLDYTPLEVKQYTFKTALNRWKIKTFDMISIDIEGSELEVLPGIDLSQTKLLVIEWNGKTELKKEYDKYTEGFEVIYTSPENIIYARP